MTILVLGSLSNMTIHTVLAFNIDENTIFKKTCESIAECVEFAKSCGVEDTDDIEVLRGPYAVIDCDEK